MIELTVKSSRRQQMIDITHEVEAAIKTAKVEQGLCVIYVPHTTAGITVNENADPDVPRDILTSLEKLVPQRANYAHIEGNADAHIKSSLVGHSVTLLVDNMRLVLGTWQGVFFCEFDGPRSRRCILKFL